MTQCTLTAVRQGPLSLHCALRNAQRRFLFK
jgi:hypothetical protein